MNLSQFRTIVERTNPKIPFKTERSVELYEYVGLKYDGSFRRSCITERLYEKIRESFKSGHGSASDLCHKLIVDLIREHVVLDVPLAPYFDVLCTLRDALNSVDADYGLVDGDWNAAVQASLDEIAFSGSLQFEPSVIYRREFAVASAARRLKNQGYAINLAPGLLTFTEASEASIVHKIEKLVENIGGLNLVRHIFGYLSQKYDIQQERYHLIPSTSVSAEPQVPWGYLVQLAAKHHYTRKSREPIDKFWPELIKLSVNYAAVCDLQPYTNHSIYSLRPDFLLQLVRETALYDSMFRLQQLRPSDTAKLCRGLLNFLSMDEQTTGGWTLAQALDVVSAFFELTPNSRGPVFIETAHLQRKLKNIPSATIKTLLEDVFSHPPQGANQNFSQPTDAPTDGNRDLGQDFCFRPLLRMGRGRFVMLDRSVCAPACLEALFTALRVQVKQFDDKVGTQAELFLECELAARGVAVKKGDYDAPPPPDASDLRVQHGECDLVIETSDHIIFAEMKKKPLTRLAKVGSDAHLLLDLTGSLLDAQKQAGWHEVRIKRAQMLALNNGSQIYDLVLHSRQIERIAVAMLDYGSFQDRGFLKQMLESNLHVNFGAPNDLKMNKRLKVINDALDEIRQQLKELFPPGTTMRQPFFHCWFLSLPQILVMLDDVNNADNFWTALRSTRHISTGSGDFYFDYSYMKTLSAAQPSSAAMQ